jgi:hypothetical protein
VLEREIRMKNAAIVALFTLSAWGCTLSDAEAGPDADASPEASVDVGVPLEWIGTTTSGVEVTVRPDQSPLRVGRIVFQLSFEQELPGDVPVSIDIISPEMPAMGLLRYMAEPSGPKTYTASTEITMEGAWEVYVNLGDGTDYAGFAFDVQPGDAGGHDHMVGVADAPGADGLGVSDTGDHENHDHDASRE